MYINPSFVEALFYISLIIASPGAYRISRVLTRYLINRYFIFDEIVVRYKCAGKIVEVKKIKASGYVVDQLKELREGA